MTLTLPVAPWWWRRGGGAVVVAPWWWRRPDSVLEQQRAVGQACRQFESTAHE